MRQLVARLRARCSPASRPPSGTAPRCRTALHIVFAAVVGLLVVAFRVTSSGASAPSISSLSQSSGTVGTTITITGANFGTNSGGNVSAGKIGWWGPFQSGVTPNNLIGGKPNGRFVGSPTFTGDGGGAFTSSASSYLLIPDGGAGGAYDWTSGAWSAQVDFQFPSSPVWSGGPILLVSKGSFAKGTGWEIELNNSALQGRYQIELESNHGLNSYHLVTAYQIVPGAFHRALIVCDQNRSGTWYVNGAAGNPQPCAPPSSGSTDLFVGHYSDTPALAAMFPISRVQIWNRALTASEATQSTTSDSGSAGTVTFNGTTASPTSWSANSIVVPVPSGATSGPVVVTVGGQTSNAAYFTVTTATPSIAGLAPNAGAAGTAVTISGANFGTSQGSSTVRFNGTTASTTYWSATSIVALVPGGATSGSVVVTVGGQSSNGPFFTIPTPPPSITSLSPASGPIGTAVTIAGANFGATAPPGKIGWWGPFQSGVTPNNLISGKPNGRFVGTPTFTGDGGGAFTSTASGYLDIPDGGAGGTYDWTSGAWSVQADFLFPATPVWGDGPLVLASKGSFAQGTGWEIRVSNSTFLGKYQIQLESNHGLNSYHLVTSYQIAPGVFHRALFVCDSTGSGTWYVNGAGWTPQPCAAAYSAASDLLIGRYSDNPAFPASVPISRVQIWNRALTAAEATVSTTGDPAATAGPVTFNGVAATTTSWSSASVVVPVPIGATSGPVVVTVGGQASNGVPFTVTAPPPTITSLSPTKGAAASVVTIAGNNFGTTQGSGSVRFNGVAGSPTTWSATGITVPVPSEATSGPVTVTVGGQTSNGVPFTVPPPVPVIMNLLPASGVVGTPVTITGANFGTGVTAPAGKIGWWGPFQSGVTPNNLISNKPNGRFVGTPTFTGDGGGAFTSSASSYVSIADGGAGGTYDWTSGAWSVQVDFLFPATPVWSGGGSIVLASKGSFGQGTGWEILIENSVLQGKYQIKFISVRSPSSYYLVTAYQIVPGAFHRALFICDSSGIGTWYVNGAPWSLQPCAAPTSAATDLMIGRYSDNPAFPAALPISRVHIWNRALTAAEATLSTTSDPPITLGPVTFNGTIATPTSWSPTTIVATVPSEATSGPVVVSVGGQASNDAGFTIVPPTFAVSGRISPPAAAVDATVSVGGTSAASAVADSAGNFSVLGLVNGTYVVTPSRANYIFAPPSQVVSVKDADVTQVNFTGAPIPPTYPISGTISPVTGGAATTVTLTGPVTRTATADGSGHYDFPGQASGNYTITPSHAGYTFTPTSQTVSLDGAMAGIDFTASVGPTTERANSYDRAWKTEWVTHARALLMTPGKTDGFVLQIGDGITHAPSYARWPTKGQGHTTEDTQVATWAHATSWSATTADVANKNGWYLAAVDTTPQRGMTASVGLSPTALASGCCNGGPDMPVSIDPITARQIVADATYASNLQIDTMLASFADAQFAVVMLGPSDPVNPNSISELAGLVDSLEARHVVPILSTIPPRNDAVSNDAAVQFNGAVAAFAQTRHLALIDFYQEVLLRRPGTTWIGTLVTSGGAEPTASGAGFSADSDPYLPGGDPATDTTGDAVSNVGYLLRSWLTVQKLKEVKKYVIDGIDPPR